MLQSTTCSLQDATPCGGASAVTPVHTADGAATCRLCPEPAVHATRHRQPGQPGPLCGGKRGAAGSQIPGLRRCSGLRPPQHCPSYPCCWHSPCHHATSGTWLLRTAVSQAASGCLQDRACLTSVRYNRLVHHKSLHHQPTHEYPPCRQSWGLHYACQHTVQAVPFAMALKLPRGADVKATIQPGNPTGQCQGWQHALHPSPITATHQQEPCPR